MSDNPFLNPQGQPQPMSQPMQSQKVGKPSWLTFFLVVTFILGSLGVLANVLVIVSPFMASWIEGMVPPPEQTEAQLEAATALKALQKEDYIPNLLFALLNFIVAPMLFIGAIGGFGRKSWSVKLLKIGFIMAIVLNILRTIYALFSQLSSMDQIKELTLKQMPPEQAEAMEMMMGPTLIGVMIFTVVLGLALVLFYLLALKKITSADVKRYMGAEI